MKTWGGIALDDEKSVFRFGAADGNGFLSRQRIAGLFDQVEKKAVIKESTRQDERRLAEINKELGVKPAETNTEESVPAEERVQGSESSEKEQRFREEIKKFLQVLISDKSLRASMDKYRNTRFTSETEEVFKRRQALNDLETFALFSGKMYDMIHDAGMTYEEVTNSIKGPDKEKFIEKFSDELGDRLTDIVGKASKVRRITEKELIDNGYSDQTNFVWFKGNAPMQPDAREVRFYLNASPEGTAQVAAQLARISDQLDSAGIRLQFKFRKDLGEYQRTDTCVAYLYIPKGSTDEQKTRANQWLEWAKNEMAQIPKDALREQSSFFTERIKDGFSYAEDTRNESGKKGESYTSKITKILAESSVELAGQYSSLTPEALDKITELAIEKLKKNKYL